MPYTRSALDNAMKNLVTSHGGVEPFFKAHSLMAQNTKPRDLARKWPTMKLDAKVRLLASGYSSTHPAAFQIVYEASADIATHGRLIFSDPAPAQH